MNMHQADGLTIAPVALFPQLLEFNFLPARYLDPGWWRPEWLPVDLFVRLQADSRAQRHLSQFLLQQFDLAAEFDFDFAREEKRLALLKPARLQRLTYLAGLMLQARRIARVISKRERQAIKQALGDADYVLAIKRGVFLLDQLGIETPPQAQGQPDAGRVREDCMRLGVGALATVMRAMPTAFVRRLQFMLPRRLVEENWQADEPGNAAYSRFLLALEGDIT